MDAPSLDQFSTSQTFDLCFDFLPPQKPDLQCSYGAPHFAYKLLEKSYGVVQGCCNHWDCPRCGIIRAKHEYGRIVEGCRTLAKDHNITFITVTCRGKELSRKDAIENYLNWTNAFLTSCRTRARRGVKRSGIPPQDWFYVQVTELQKRGHPHSHILTTFNPLDTFWGKVEKYETLPSGQRKMRLVDALRSDWLQEQVVKSGLGNQYDISVVDTIEGASRYVAKYLFKDSIFTTVWPDNWKRVRYSHSFPKLPDRETNAFVLLSHEDWYKLSRVAKVVRVKEAETRDFVKDKLRLYNTIIK